MFKDYLFNTPCKILAGIDTRKTLGKQVKKYAGKVVLICTDKKSQRSGLLVDILESLSRENLAYVIFDELDCCPTIEIVEQGLNQYRNEECDILLAVGGSSAIDTAKVISSLTKSPGESTCQEAPVIAVPTNASLGSEFHNWSVITDDLSNKTIIMDRVPTPKLVIMDPYMLQVLNATMAGQTGLQILSIAIDGYVSLGSYELTDILNLKAIELTAKNLRRFVANRRDLESATAVQNAGLYAALGSANSGLGNVFAMTTTLANHSKIAAGKAWSVILPRVMKYNAMACPDKFVNIAKCFGEKVSDLPINEAALKSVDGVAKLISDIDLPSSFNSQDIPHGLIEILSQKVLECQHCRTNPRDTKLDHLVSLFSKTVS
ncbi:iron-containing alcohol dehydrogenase [Desulforamulus aquiferis]|uniref:Iron-containing alcohol dehydrogenase n=1 Tax=Desulforamulus aquiferis TaxID=1397668 RepID=A0AAW7ZEH2_9FIRM|nr:iron-containing alcohol dehydrogenase [Desulforamulus aquiferis]MDO7787702.1 iron-containing alcohol dehydrogenase [Desulforamulus aquiferis]